MKTCPRCLSPVEDGLAFCGVCGLAMEECEAPVDNETEKETPPTHIGLDKVVEPTQVIETLDEFDPAHTRSFDADAVKEAVKEPPKTDKKGGKHFKKLPVKWIAIGAAAVVLVTALVALLMWIFRDKTIAYTAYVQDGRLMLLNTKTGESTLICDDVLAANGNVYEQSPVITADGKTVFYTTPQENGVALFRCRFDDPVGTAQKVADRVTSYIVSQNGEAALYIDGGKELYYTDFETKDKLGTIQSSGGCLIYEGGPLLLSEDGKTAVYRLWNNELYEMTAGQEPVLVAQNAKNIYGLKADLSAYYYTVGAEDGGDAVTLYKRTGGKSARVDTEVENVSLDESGKGYYTKREKHTVRLMDYVIDDVSATLPKEPVLPNREDYLSTQEFWEAQNQYYADKAAYEASLETVELRDSLLSETMTVSKRVLYYYDGTKATKIGPVSSEYIRYAANKAVAIYGDVDVSTIGKTELSRLSSVAQLRDALENAFKKNQKTYIVVGTNKRAVDIPHDVLATVQFSADGTRLMYVSGRKPLYELTTDENGNQVTTHYAQDDETVHVLTLDENGGVTAKVSQSGGATAWHTESGLMFTAPLNEMGGRDAESVTMYDGDKKIAEHVYGVMAWDADTQTAYYMVDYNADTQRGKVMMYKRGDKPKKLADDVHELVLDDSGRVTYLTDYDASSKLGTLMLYDSGVHKKIAEEVSAVETTMTPDDFKQNGCLQLKMYGNYGDYRNSMAYFSN